MSSYFYHRTRNLPTTTTNTTSVAASSRTEVAPVLSDQELLESALEFEKTATFQQAEQEAKKARESTINDSKIHPFFKLPNGAANGLSPSKSKRNADERLKDAIQSILTSTKKRPASDTSDDEVIPIAATSPVVVRRPVKRLPTSKPDFHTFAPPNQTVGERTKSLLHNLGPRRARGESVAMTQIIAEEQLRLREKLMRKPKATPTDEKVPEKSAVAPGKRKANEIEPSTSKKVRTGPKNAFDKLVQEMTETMTLVTLTNTTTTSTTTVSSSASSASPLIDLTVVQSTSSISSTLPLHSNGTSRKEVKPRTRKIYTYDDYLIHILKWPVSLIDELEPEAGALYKEFLGDNRYPVPLLELYLTFDEYEEITLPWLFEETFEEIKRSVKMNDHKLAKVEFDAVVPQIRLFKSGLYEFKSQILQKRTPNANQRREMFTEDDLLVITLVDQQNKKLFGLVRSGERVIEKARLHRSLLDHPDVKIQPPVWICLEYNIRVFGSGMKIPDGSKVKLRAVASLTATLRRFKALASMRSSPLFEALLSPKVNDQIFQIPTKQENSMDEKYFQAYNESQRNVINEAVSMMCDANDDTQAKIYMCQGPPGTGKSQTITGIVRALLQPMPTPPASTDQSPTITSSVISKKKPKILICCPSNGGCNEIVRRLIDVFSRKPSDLTTDPTASKLTIKLIRCARGGAVSEDIENVSLDLLAQKRLEEVLNTGGQNEAIERNLANKEKQKKQLQQRIEEERSKPNSTEELKDLELNLKEITASIHKLQQTCRKTMPEAARRQREREIKLELLQEADICVSTLNYVGNAIFDTFSPFDPNLQLHKADTSKKASATVTLTTLFNCLIIDEAGQCIEIDNFIPLRLGMNRIILVGDPEQLPATVLSTRALEAGLNQSLFERLYRLFKYDLDNPIRMLNIQYRMHDEICKFPSMHIYRSKLKTDKITNQKRKKFLLKPYMVLDAVNGQEEQDAHTQSYGNPLEAEIAACLVQFINEQAKVPFSQIGIITPYAYQVRLIEQQLAKRHLQQQKIDMGTVDAFQGRQKDVIILSCVRATSMTDPNTIKTIGFVANRQRLNVSLTRAKYAMYILGHMNSLNINEDWQKLHSNAVERKTLVQLTSPNQFDSLIKRHQEAPTNPSDSI